MPERLYYLIRPDDTALWLPEEIISQVDAWEGEKLTEEQFNHAAIQQWIADHRIKQPRK